jgi:hypothetical protein
LFVRHGQVINVDYRQPARPAAAVAAVSRRQPPSSAVTRRHPAGRPDWRLSDAVAFRHDLRKFAIHLLLIF